MEVLVVSVYVLQFNKPKKMIIGVIIINAVTMPIVWYIFPAILGNIILTYLVVELLVVLIEATFLYLVFSLDITFKTAIILSMIMNIASFMVMPVIILSKPQEQHNTHNDIWGYIHTIKYLFI
jgi:hypothetical protein